MLQYPDKPSLENPDLYILRHYAPFHLTLHSISFLTYPPTYIPRFCVSSHSKLQLFELNPANESYVSALANVLALCILHPGTDSFYHSMAYQLMACQHFRRLPQVEALKDACRNAVGTVNSSSTTTTTAVTAAGHDAFCPGFCPRLRAVF